MQRAYRFVAALIAGGALVFAVPATATAPPKVMTGPAHAVTYATATLTGAVDPEGDATTYDFQYGTTTAYGSTTSSTPAGSGTKAVAASAALTGLTAGTAYHYRIVASWSGGTVNGPDHTFSTPPPGPPAVTVGAVQNITYSGATLTAAVNPRGGSTVYEFEYGTTSAYGTDTTSTPAGSGTTPVAVTAVIGGLTPATTYHYRLVATNARATINSPDYTFTTAAIPLSLQLTSTPNPVTFGGTLLVEGTLSGTGNGDHAIILQANPFPYTGGFLNIGNPELTNANGTFEFAFPGLEQTAQLRVVTMDANPTSSPVVVERVAASVTFNATRTKRKHYVRLYGRVTPAEPGTLISFERYIGHGFVNVGGTDTKTVVGKNGSPGYSSFSRVFRVNKPGAYRAFAQVGGGAQTSANSGSILIH